MSQIPTFSSPLKDHFIVSEIDVFHFPGLSGKEEWSNLLNMKKQNYYRQG